MFQVNNRVPRETLILETGGGWELGQFFGHIYPAENQFPPWAQGTLNMSSMGLDFMKEILTEWKPYLRQSTLVCLYSLYKLQNIEINNISTYFKFFWTENMSVIKKIHN